MTIPQFVIQFLAGLANAMFLFLIASGLSLIFGVSRIVNFAHGSSYMLSAYLASTVITWLSPSPWAFWAALIVAPAAVASLGALVEILLLRRIYQAPELHQLVLTFGLMLIAGDAVRYFWGTANRTVPTPPVLAGSVPVLGQPFPVYYLLVIALGPLVTLGLWWVFSRTRWGILVRAATEDREMVAALGVNQSWLFTTVFVFGTWLAALGGGLAAPLVAIAPGMDATVIVEAFVVVVVGGMGSFGGSLLASLLIGELSSFGILVLPRVSLILPFALMAAVLVIRPWGLLGRPFTELHGEAVSAARSPAFSRAALLAWGSLLAGLALLPLVLPAYDLLIGIEMLLFALLASSLQLLMGYGGMVSFGHAAYFGLGAYAAALLSTKAGLPWLAALGLAPVVAAAGGLLFGVFCVRLTAIYFAMLTLAFAQITYTVAHQWYDFTGGDNGILGVWPPPWLAGPSRYYLFTLGVVALAVALLGLLVRSSFGLAVQAIRDDPRRAGAVGLNVTLHQLVLVVVAAALAGLAGALFAFQKGSVFPDYLFVTKSIEPLVMVLLGGVRAFAGPLIGAFVYTLLDTVVTASWDYWGAVLGLVLTGLVLLFPQGMVGAALPQLRRGWAWLTGQHG
ncbi:MAG: ABC transporter permease [Candidatus Methylomirabilales bacterium]